MKYREVNGWDVDSTITSGYYQADTAKEATVQFIRVEGVFINMEASEITEQEFNDFTLEITKPRQVLGFLFSQFQGDAGYEIPEESLEELKRAGIAVPSNVCIRNAHLEGERLTLKIDESHFIITVRKL